MKGRNLIICLLISLPLLTAPARAQSGLIAVDREVVEIFGTLGSGALTGSLRLTAEQEVGDLVLLASDLMDVTGSGVLRDPIPASALSINPAAEWEQLAAGKSVQVAFQVAPPAEVGIWSGTLTVRWGSPEPGELQLPLTLTARNRPALSVAEPGRLKVTGVRGQQVPRTFLLRETANGVPTTGLQVVTQDLPGSQGGSVLPADRIQAGLPDTQLEGGGWMTVSVIFDLGGVPSGEYTGSLLVTDDYHNALTVPLEVSVKDRALWPVLVLILGVALGRSISTYRTRGRPRDRLTLRIAALRDQVRQERQFQEVLQGSVEKILIQAEAELVSGDWEKGNEAAERAEALIMRWRQDRAEWVEQIERIRDLSGCVEGMTSEAPTVQELRRRLVRIDLEDFETPEAMEEEVTRVKVALSRFEQLAERLRQIRHVLQQHRGHLPAEVFQAWQIQVEDLQRRLDVLRTDDETEVQVLADDMVAKSRELKAAIDNYSRMEGRRKACVGEARTAVNELGSPGSPTLPIASAADQALQRVEGEQDRDPESTTDWAENIWRGTWSALHILPLAGEEPGSVAEAGRALRSWLSDGNNYLQATDSFRAALKERESALQTALQASQVAVEWPVELPPPQAPAAKGILTDLHRLEISMALESTPTTGLELAEAIDEAALSEPPSGCLAGLLKLFAFERPRAREAEDAQSSRARLRLFTITTYIVALGLLAWVGFNELYASSATFGAKGALDYFALLVWGFGAEATRSAVTDLVTGLVEGD